MSFNPQELLVSRLLHLMGYAVEKIPAGTDSTPDLAVPGDAVPMTIEVKGVSECKQLLATIRGGEFAAVVDTTSVKGRFDHVLDDAAFQLRSFSKTNDLSIVWMVVESPVADHLRALQIFSTLYGVAWFNVNGHELPCLFGTYSWFFTHPEVCAVVVTEFGATGLRVNPYSPQLDDLRKSRLYTALGRARGVFEPCLARPTDDCLVAPMTPPLGGHAKVAAWLSGQLGIEVKHCIAEASCAGKGVEQFGCTPSLPWEECKADHFVLNMQLTTRSSTEHGEGEAALPL